MKKLTYIIISICYVLFGVISYSYAQPITGSNTENKLKILEVYLTKQTEYPYEIIGAVEYEGLQSDETRVKLKEQAISMGADAIVQYRNQKLHIGFKAEGIAIRWKGAPIKDNH